MFARLFIQLIILLIIATVIGFLLTHIGINLWLGIVTGIIAQLIGYNTFTAILDSHIALKNKKIENERIKEFTLQGLEVTCPCSKQQKEFVPIRLNTNNTYRCNTCSKPVSVFISAETAIQTEPVLSTDTSTAILPILEQINNGNS
jgi:hypothetical protein